MANDFVNVSARLASGIYRAGQIDALRKMADRFQREVRGSEYSMDGREDRMVIPDHMLGVEYVWRELMAEVAELEGEQDG